MHETSTEWVPLLRTAYRFRAVGEGRLPGFAGSAWRGAFGHALKRAVCIMRLRPCCGCPLERTCLYPTLFHAAPDPAARRLSRLQSVAQPYVLMPPPQGPRFVRPGDPIRLDVTLVGRAIGQRAYVRRALERAAEGGIGPDRLRLELESVAMVPGPPSPPPDDLPLTIRFLTPLRLKRDGQLITPETLAPADLLMALLRRVSMLGAFHAQQPLRLDFLALKATAATARWQHRALGWQETRRYSTRQLALLAMGGVVGEAVLAPAPLGAFRELLALAPWIGVGKGASMGLGQVQIEAAA
jgi:hypothetical protein